jgi:hypothetical protein
LPKGKSANAQVSRHNRLAASGVLAGRDNKPLRRAWRRVSEEAAMRRKRHRRIWLSNGVAWACSVNGRRVEEHDKNGEQAAEMLLISAWASKAK